MEPKHELIEIAALWKSKSKNGDEYWSGTLGKGQLLVFANKYKAAENHPDLRVYIKFKEPKNEKEGQPGIANPPKFSSKAQPVQSLQSSVDQAKDLFDEIPF